MRTRRPRTCCTEDRASMSNTPEYRTIIQCTPELTTALKNDLVSLSGELLAAGLISDDNSAAIRNPFVDASQRASQLVGFIRNRISLDTANYHSFIRILKQREDDHKEILQILYKKYGEFGACHCMGRIALAYTVCVASSAIPGGWSYLTFG